MNRGPTDREDMLSGRVALVTGGTGGIGLAIAHRLGHTGARVSICGRNPSKLDHAAAELRSAGIEVLASEADVTRENQIAGMVQKTQQTFGPIDILVNNAGIGLFGAFQDKSEGAHTSHAKTVERKISQALTEARFQMGQWTCSFGHFCSR